MEQREEVESQTAADMLAEMIKACGPAKQVAAGIRNGIHWAELDCPEFRHKRKGVKMTEEQSRTLKVGATIGYSKFWYDGHYEHCAGGIGVVTEVSDTGVHVNFEQPRGAMGGGITFFTHDEMMRHCTEIVGVQNAAV